jgi:chaperone required for assembly of F1-ATPase
MDADEAWDAASVDEDFQMAAWGEDAEALARRERRLQEMRAAALISRAFAG